MTFAHHFFTACLGLLHMGDGRDVSNLHCAAANQRAATSASAKLCEGHSDRHRRNSLFPLLVERFRGEPDSNLCYLQLANVS